MMPDVFIFATDTVYGIGARCDDRCGIDQLYRLKDRAAEQPMQVLVASHVMAASLVHLGPGHILDAETRIYSARVDAPVDPRLICDGGIGVRQPRHHMLRDYILGLGGAIAATSANLRGEPALCNAEDVAAVFPGIPIVVTGDCSGGTSSQLWDMRWQPPKRLR